MGSNFFGSEKSSSSSSSSSSRKNKRSSLTDKPRQPQRGLGVAQLEQIRLRSQMACGFNPPNILQEDVTRGQPYGVAPIQSTSSYPNYSQSSPSTSSTYAHQHNFMMTFGEHNLRCHDSQPSTTTLGWNPDSVGLPDNSAFGQAGMPSRQLPYYFQDERHSRIDLMRSSSQNSESNDHEEVDLELRLSL